MDQETQRQLRMLLGRTAVIGVGRVGSALARLLGEAGLELKVHDADAARARTVASSVPRAISAGLAEVAKWARTVFLSTPDDQLARVAKQLAGHRPSIALAVHLSGSRSLDELKPLAELGVATGGLHPVQTFRGAEGDWRLFLGCNFALEGDERSLPTLERFVELLGGVGFRIDSATKALYHAACVAASNFLVVLWNLVERLALQCDLTPKDVRALLMPLAERTLKNLREAGPLLALTGPYARGDVQTVEKHVELLNRSAGFGERRLYHGLARAAVILSRDAGNLSDEDANRLLTALEGLAIAEPQTGGDAFVMYPDEPSGN